ncbi:carbohydrate-binding family 9-like protein [Foetidibacter luteolus]|uniref:carbohydrate-binding family 9-like protein n=1 Tax=Foetidibacter luteolus TaxID=2608880 RepID=UPI00129BE360|nr:carbohydrate-binding family 9-like protein [Foetidibacter luteolus]
MKKLTLFLCCYFLHYSSVNAQTYFIKKVPAGSIKITGQGKDKAWKKANRITDFSYPWQPEEAPSTSFSALWDGAWMYCLFTVEDDSVNVYFNSNDKLETGASDRVEIFFNINDSMQPYYCLEIDANARVLDYSAGYYRKMQYDWQWPANQLIIQSSRTSTGYIVEMAISIESLENLGLLKSNRLRAGLFRVECKGFTDGKADLHWISWVRPGSTDPDFHIPSAFGTLMLEL